MTIKEKYDNTLSQISEIEEIAEMMIKTLPRLNRNKLREELTDMSVEVLQDPTTFDINSGLAKTQGYKDRLAAILNLATREYNRRKEVFQMLLDANNVMSKASSADKRKGEAILKYKVYLFQLEAAETFMEEIERAFNNMKAKGEIISRQASVLAAQIQLNEYVKRRPEHLHTNSEAEEIDYKTQTKNISMDWGQLT